MSDAIMHCRCGHNSPWPTPLSFRAECPACATELHACRYCAHYTPGHHNDCAETQAERVVDNERGNRCDWFRPGGAIGQKKKEDSRSAAQALFRK